ncbi:MAG: DUF2332 domain-containing protein [Syntrophaceae bacterium]
MSHGEQQREEIAKSFSHSARHEFHGSSPLYEIFATGMSEDTELLFLASNAISKPVPMIFLAAVHFLLLNGTEHPIAAYYPDMHSEPHSPEAGIYPLFREFCFQHQDEIKKLIITYHVQTNEVRRCACFLPAFGLAAEKAQGLPLALVEIGASAGLNLFWDRYGYDYGNGIIYGNRTSPVQLTCTMRGDMQPPLPEAFPQIIARIGIDLNPIDVRDPSAVNWLKAFIWPEHTARFDLLHRAIEIVQNTPPELRKGDALEILPGVIDALPPDSYPCLFHSFVSNQMSPEERYALANIIANHGSNRNLCSISIDLSDKYKYPRLDMLSYNNDMKEHRHLANCSGHSRWLEWLE